MRVYNFSPGPSMLPLEVLRQAQSELVEYRNGMSPLEISHRGSEFHNIIDESKARLKQLLTIPDNYQILFMQGGATGQFSAVPLNLLNSHQQADYIRTGIWGEKAVSEAQKYGDIHIAACTQNNGYTTIPKESAWQLNPNAAYVHYTPNETINGVEFHFIPDTKSVPLVADMSSNILSRPVDISRFGLIYAGAQKNMGPAGVTLVIVRDDLIGNAMPQTPSILDYAKFKNSQSCYNTAPTFTWYMVNLMLAWMIKQGGVAKFAEINKKKATKLYEAIDRSSLYYNKVDKNARSIMNVVFSLKDTALEQPFLTKAAEKGLANLKGHRLVGGMRASIYNAMPEAGVDALINFMADFEKQYA